MQDDEGHIVAWRGSIDHVGSDQRLYFHDLEGILRFIEEQTGMDAGRPSSKWKALLARIRDDTA
jgi:hypothetical protein